MVDVDVITECWIPGIPKTKGSLNFRGNGYVEENVKGSARWRRLVAAAVRTDLLKRWNGIQGDPAGGPVGVRLQFWLPIESVPHADVTSLGKAPGSEMLPIHVAPIAVRSGDLDKLVRNVLDALTDAKAYADDVQVVRVIADKFACEPELGETAGLALMAWLMTPREVATDRGLARRVRDSRAVQG